MKRQNLYHMQPLFASSSKDTTGTTGTLKVNNPNNCNYISIITYENTANMAFDIHQSAVKQ